MSSIPNGHEMAPGDTDSVAVGDSLPQSEDSSKSKTEKDDKAEDAAKTGEEMVVIQDTGFNISIVAPGVEPFDLPVSGNSC